MHSEKPGRLEREKDRGQKSVMEAFRRTEVRLGYTDVTKILSQPVGAHVFNK